jgi:glycosyltransferase involved in cell wall biosynthesis
MSERGEPTASSPRMIGVPWQAPVFRDANSQHPLPRSLIADTAEFVFDPGLASGAQAQALAKQDGAALRAALCASLPHIDQTEVDRFIASRDLESQAQMSSPMDLLFLHTAPLTFGQRPWAMHIESTLPMFEPFFGHFRTWDIDLDATPAWHFVRHLVGAPQCRAIFTHLRRTQEDLPRLFRNGDLARKVHYAPLGFEMPAELRRSTEDAIARKNAKAAGDELVFLFTNSWHQAPDSFVKRGGLEVLMAFLVLIDRQPNCRLILRSQLPPYVEKLLPFSVRGHPKIEFLDEMIPEAALYELFLRADVFLLPSTNLHTISMLRAMATGGVLITTDVSSIDEFVTDEENGLVLPAWKGISYRDDLESGLLREQSKPRRDSNTVLAANLSVTLLRIAADRELRNRLRMNARRHVADRHRMGPWRDGFHSMLRASLAPP